MGLCSSTTVQKTELPEPSAEEKAMMAMMTEAMMPAMMEQAGYEVQPVTADINDDPKYQSLRQQRSTAEQRVAEQQELLERARSTANYNALDQATSKLNQERIRLKKIDDRITQYENEFEPTQQYSFRKMADPETEEIRRRYGEDSEEYRSAYRAYQEREGDKYFRQEKLVNAFMDKTMKFLSGDFSITQEQKDLIAQRYAPQRAAISQMFEDITRSVKEGAEGVKEKVAVTEKTLIDTADKTFKDFISEVDKTKMNTADALATLGDQIQKTGKDMKSALKDIVSVNKELMKMGIEDYTGAITRKMAGVAEGLGRDPSDPEFLGEIQEKVAREVQRGSLNLAQMEAEGMLGIEERTGSEMENLMKSYAVLEETTGEKKERGVLARGERVGAIQERAGIAREQIEGTKAQKFEDIARGRGMANVGLEEQIANMKYQIGAGMPPQQIQTAMGTADYQRAIEAQKMANLQSAGQLPVTLTGMMQQERMAQPTTTTKQTGSILGTLFGALSGGAQAYSGIASAGAMRNFAKTGIV